jgi:uncharacterized membrane-anchored protein YhcB (DUF1043 family)
MTTWTWVAIGVGVALAVALFVIGKLTERSGAQRRQAEQEKQIQADLDKVRQDIESKSNAVRAIPDPGQQLDVAMALAEEELAKINKLRGGGK